MKTYCPLCSRQTGTGHEPWCPINDDITLTSEVEGP